MERAAVTSTVDVSFVRLVIQMMAAPKSKSRSVDEFHVLRTTSKQGKVSLPFSSSRRPVTTTRDGDELIIPHSMAFDVAASTVVSSMRLSNTHKSCDTVGPCISLIGNLTSFVALMDTVTFGHFLEQPPEAATWKDLPWSELPVTSHTAPGTSTWFSCSLAEAGSRPQFAMVKLLWAEELQTECAALLRRSLELPAKNDDATTTNKTKQAKKKAHARQRKLKQRDASLHRSRLDAVLGQLKRTVRVKTKQQQAATSLVAAVLSDLVSQVEVTQLQNTVRELQAAVFALQQPKPPPSSTSTSTRSNNLFVSVPASVLPPKTKLHWDICEFVTHLQAETHSRLAAHTAVSRFCVSAVQALWPRAQVRPYGSFVTGLSLPS
ncbi:hypothetical protein DYB25_008904, partial [Aphanomyces astaci]